jgi:2-phosphosulfolactate phosphatase
MKIEVAFNNKFSCKNIILKTTNGTKSFFKTENALASYGLSLVNMGYCMDRIIEKSQKTGSAIFLLASGEKGKTSFDDFYVAGLSVSYLLERGIDVQLGDDAKVALALSRVEADHFVALKKSRSADSLIRAGLSEDLPFCARKDLYCSAPLLQSRQNNKKLEKILSGRKVLTLRPG